MTTTANNLFPLVPHAARLGWSCALLSLENTAYALQENQFFLPIDGMCSMQIRKAHEIEIKPKQGIHLAEPCTVEATGKTRALVIEYSELNSCFAELVAPYFETKIEMDGYTVYPIVKSAHMGPECSVALLELRSSPRHYHKIGTELFLVLAGELQIEIDGVDLILKTKQLATIDPYQSHQLRSGRETPVRLLCINFPAFNPTDYYLLP